MTGPIIKNEIRSVAISELVPAPYNPRTISAEALKGLGASLERFGLVQPIVWNKRTRHIVGGHQRVIALRAAGVTETTAIVVDLSKIEEKALNVTLNNPLIAGEFTPSIEAILKEIEAALPDYYKRANLDQMLALDLFPVGAGAISAEEARKTMAERFGVPPFSILDARQGYWQDRKRAWIALGITSELGRGENLLSLSAACNLQKKGKAYK